MTAPLSDNRCTARHSSLTDIHPARPRGARTFRHGILGGYLLLAPLVACSGTEESADGASGGTDSEPSETISTTSDCEGVEFAVTTTLSEIIGTVGIVEWSTTTAPGAAHIDFGRDPTAFEYQAPVTSPNVEGNRTLLLGMKPSTTYHYQIVIESGGVTCRSQTQELTTDPIRNGLPTPKVETTNEEALYEGFTVFAQSGGGTPGGGAMAPAGDNSAWALILDRDGDIVWWYQPSGMGQISRARLSYDGQYLLVGNINVEKSGGAIHRVRLDGSEEEAFDVSDYHHDFTVLPDNSIAYIRYADSSSGTSSPPGGMRQEGCDTISLLNPETGTKTDVFNVAEANPDQSENCHSNAINWWPDLGLYSVSVLNWNSILTFDSGGVLAWVLGGNASDFDGASWSHQHQHHLIADDRILLFTNNASNASSAALEYSLVGSTASLELNYAPGLLSSTLGGASRLPNGNSLVVFSNVGVLHEISSTGELLREIGIDSAGYARRRPTLYGPPPTWGG